MSLIDYKPGDIIQSNCQPFYKTLNQMFGKGNICDECFKIPEYKISLKRCSGCLLMYYCSKHCQTIDWKNGHKVECSSKTFCNNLKNCTSNDNNIDLKNHLFRAMSFLIINPELAQKQYYIYNGKTRCFNDLMSHQEYFENKNNFKMICMSLASDIIEEKLDTGHIYIDTNFFLKLIGIFQTNGFTIYNESETIEIGSGIYIESSVYNHSCKPTAVFCSKGCHIEIRAITSILKGDEPLISYISNHAGKMERQEILKRRYNFECHCERCDSKMDDNVDFDQLNSLIQYMITSTINNDSVFFNSEDKLLEIHKIVIEMMNKIYNEFDDRISNQYSRTLFALISNKYRLYSTTPMKKLIEDTRIHLKISCGENHPEYCKFERAIEINSR